MARGLEIIDPTAVVDFSREITREKLQELPAPALVYLLSVADHNAHPGGEISKLTKSQLVERTLGSRTAGEEIFARFQMGPGIFNRLHLSLWDDAFPKDDRDYCRKMRFAAAFLDEKNRMVTRSQNKRMTAVIPGSGERLCTATSCIRDQITSRTEAVMGDCGHAYFWGIKELWDAGWGNEQIKGLKKYEAGFNLKSKNNPDVFYEPWVGKESTYTCPYCITVLGWFLDQPEVTVLKNLDGQGPRWVDIKLPKAFHQEIRGVAQKQGLKIPS